MKFRIPKIGNSDIPKKWESFPKYDRPLKDNQKLMHELRELQEWALTGIRLVKLPTVEEYGSEESDMALLRYCYYRMMYQIAGCITGKPDVDITDDLIHILFLVPLGCHVSKIDVITLCSLGEILEFKEDVLFPKWSVYDVAQTIFSQESGTEDLLKAAIEDVASLATSSH